MRIPYAATENSHKTRFWGKKMENPNFPFNVHFEPNQIGNCIQTSKTVYLVILQEQFFFKFGPKPSLDVENKIFAVIIGIWYTTSLNTHKRHFWTRKQKIQKSDLNVKFNRNLSLVVQSWIFYWFIGIWCVTSEKAKKHVF